MSWSHGHNTFTWFHIPDKFPIPMTYLLSFQDGYEAILSDEEVGLIWTTVILWPFSLLMQGLVGGSAQQPPSPLPIFYIFPFQPALCNVPFHHLAPCHPRPSPSSLTFHFKWHDLFHPIIIILPQHVPTILTYSISQHQTLTQSPFSPLTLHLALYASAIHHTSISPSSSPYIPISHSAPVSWPTFHFHIP